jgi:hypothetical protein
MAKSKPATDIDETLEAITDNVENNEMAILAINDKIDQLSSLINKAALGPIQVSNIDGNLHFQKCVEIATTALISNVNPQLLLKNKSHLEVAVDDILSLAEALHSGICTKFAIEVN